MTQVFFLTQIDRLKRRFGEKHFDTEFIKLAQWEVGKMSEAGLQRVVDVWIGNRKPHDPPLMANFIEAKLAEEKQALSRAAFQAGQFMVSTEVKSEGLKKILQEQFGGCASVNEAVEWVILQNRLRGA